LLKHNIFKPQSQKKKKKKEEEVFFEFVYELNYINIFISSPCLLSSFLVRRTFFVGWVEKMSFCFEGFWNNYFKFRLFIAHFDFCSLKN